MRLGYLLVGYALLNVCAAASTDNTGTIQRNGKKFSMTAIYVEPKRFPQGAQNIVFSDSPRATKIIEDPKRTSFAYSDFISADAIMTELIKHGAHPLEVSISTVGIDTQMVSVQFDTRPSNEKMLTESSVKLRLDRNDDQRLEGSLKYDDSALKLELQFALDPGKFGKPSQPPPEPPPPPAVPSAKE